MSRVHHRYQLRVFKSLIFGFTLLIVTERSWAFDNEPEIGRLCAHVALLASRDFEGRSPGSAGGLKAATYIRNQFESLGLEPLFNGRFDQPIPGKQPGSTVGQNIGAKLRGYDPHQRDEWIIVSAHYDHLGLRQGVLYPGADDNASGVAMLLEVARCFSQLQEKTRKSIMFVAFDAEESGLLGSSHFCEHPPVPLSHVSLFVTADMLGRSLGGTGLPVVFVFGTESSPELRPLVQQATRSRLIKPGFLGNDLLLIDRSDYGPFRRRKIPYLFFTTGENPLYHRPQDSSDSLDYPRLEASSCLILSLLQQIISQSSKPSWSDKPHHSIDEAKVIQEVVQAMLHDRERLGLKPGQVGVLMRLAGQLEPAIRRGSLELDERQAMVRMVQFVLFSIL